MFAPRFFCRTQFAGRYFPPVTGSSTPAPTVILTPVKTTIYRKRLVSSEVVKS